MIDFIHYLKKPNMKKKLFAILCAAAVILGCSTGNSGNNKPAGTEETTAENTTSVQKCIHLDAEGFKQKVFDINSETQEYLGDKPAIIDFYADWCGPCRQLSPTLEEIAQSHAGEIYVYKVNVDDTPELCEFFEISSIPTLMFVPMEGEPSISVGLLSKSQLETYIKDVLMQ